MDDITENEDTSSLWDSSSKKNYERKKATMEQQSSTTHEKPTRGSSTGTTNTPPSNPAPTGELVKTLYITGLPYDVKEREIQLLCRPHPGFEFCNLNLRSDPPSAFAKFSSREASEAALEALQGFQFDLNHPDLSVRVDFAKSDTMRKTVSMEYYEDPLWESKRRRTSSSGRSAASSDHNYYRYYPDSYYAATAAMSARDAYHSKAHYDAYGYGYSHYHPGVHHHPNASTLFVGNLPPGCTEEDLLPLFRNFSGFKSLRLATLKNRQVISFVTFADPSHCAYALSQVLGIRLRNYTLRIEFAQERNAQ